VPCLRELLRRSRLESQQVGREPQECAPDDGSHGRIACKPPMGLGAPFPKDGRFGNQQAAVCGFISEAANGRQSQVDRGRCVVRLLTRPKNCSSRSGASARVSSTGGNRRRPATPSLNRTKRQEWGSGLTSTTSQCIKYRLRSCQRLNLRRDCVFPAETPVPLHPGALDMPRGPGSVVGSASISPPPSALVSDTN
jgi:hypothetical protein